MYLRTRQLGLWHWWGLAPPKVAQAICTAGVAYATDGAAGQNGAKACAKVFKDKKKKPPVVVQTQTMTAWVRNGSQWVPVTIPAQDAQPATLGCARTLGCDSCPHACSRKLGAMGFDIAGAIGLVKSGAEAAGSIRQAAASPKASPVAAPSKMQPPAANSNSVPPGAGTSGGNVLASMSNQTLATAGLATLALMIAITR